MRLNIHFKITLIFGLIWAVILFGIFLYLNQQLQGETLQKIRENLLKQTRLSKTFLENSRIKTFTIASADPLADTISNDLDLRVTIINLEGVVLGDSQLTPKEVAVVENHFDRPEVQDALQSGIGESKRYSVTTKQYMLYMAKVLGKDAPSGIIRLSIPLHEIEHLSRQLKMFLLGAFLVAFLLSLFITFLSSVFISRPLREMSWISKSISRGDFSQRANIISNDEIGDLARALNQMSEQIRQRIEEVTTAKVRLESVLLSMFGGVMVVDNQGHILLLNQTLKNVLHVVEDPIGKRPLEIVRNIEIQEIVDNILRMKEGVDTRELALVLPEEKILLIHATPVIREGKSEGAVLVFHDITELRRLEKIRKDFVANVSHELRTPVASIKGYAETLLEGAIEDKKNAKDFIEIIYSDANRLAQLIGDLLDLSRLESGKTFPQLKSCRLAPIVKRVVSGFKKPARTKSITINVDIPSKLPFLYCDESLVAQVLFNLIDNGIKYTLEEGTITISARQAEAFVKISVADTGVGIPEKDLARIFERFYRVDKGRSRELGGTGLGLSIVKHIVQEHGGEVFVESIEGKGSTFSFTIPAATPS